MPTIGDVVRLNNQQFSWNSTITRIAGIPWPGVVAIDWSEKLDVETVYSQTQDGTPQGATAGQYEVDGFTMRMLTDSADKLTDMISAIPPFVGSYGRTEFPIVCSASEPLLPGGFPIVMTAGVCRIVGKKQVREKGIAALVTEFAIWSKGIIENGKTLYSPKIPLIGAVL
jgi:hypothetical protein